MARRLSLPPPATNHGMAEVVQEVQFVTRDYASLTGGACAFLFVENMAVGRYKLCSKSIIWDNAQRGNVRISID